VVGKPVSIAHGQEIIRALTRGDASELSAVGLTGPARMPVDAMTEFGLGRTSDGRAVIIRGQGGAVDWAGLPGIHPDGHSHPSVPKNDLYDGSIKIEKLLEKTPVPLVERALVFPSNADVIMMADHGIEGHAVFTPFTFDGKVVKKSSGNAPPLEITIKNARHIGQLEEGVPVYNAGLEGTAGKHHFEVEIWIVGGSEDGKMQLTPPPGVSAVGDKAKPFNKPAKSTQADTLQPKPSPNESSAKSISPMVAEAAQHLHEKVPALVTALEKGGIGKAELEELRGRYGDAVVHALDMIIGSNKQQSRAAVKLVFAAEQIGAHPAVKDPSLAQRLVDAIASGRLDNPKGLKKILEEKILGELNHPKGPTYGTLNVLSEVLVGVQNGKRMGLEGRKVDARDAESGKADLINYSDKVAIQNKVVTGNAGMVVANIKEALNQLSGATGETPPVGYAKKLRVVLDGSQSMRGMSKADLIATIRATKAFEAEAIRIPADVDLLIINDVSGAEGFAITNFEGAQ
jgi:hypothetical protein